MNLSEASGGMAGVYVYSLCVLVNTRKRVCVYLRCPVSILTEQYDDTDEYGYDRSGPQSSGSHSSGGSTVSVVITRTHLDLYNGPVREGRVTGVRHDDGNIIHLCIQVGNPQSQLGIVTCT